MKSCSILALTALSSAFVLPNQQVSNLAHVEKESPHTSAKVLNDLEDAFDHASANVRTTFDQFSRKSREKYQQYSLHGDNAFDEAISYVGETGSQVKQEIHSQYFDTQSWIESTKDRVLEVVDESSLGLGHHHPHHPPHHPSKPNMTVYELIANSKYLTKFTTLINEYDDLVETLNGTSANFTVFAPVDWAFPDHAPKPSKEFLKALLTYHISPEFYPASRVLTSRTIPSLLKSPGLSKKPLPQRIATELSFKGLTVNFYSRVVAVNVFGTNGVIHGLNSILLPPPKALTILDLLPGDFSTLELGLTKTGLFKTLEEASWRGGTFFVPHNFAFLKLGYAANAFLFSDYGLKYLKALLQYHIVPKATLYSDAFYEPVSSNDTVDEADFGRIPKGQFHVDLPTMLKDRSLSVDIGRFGRLIDIKINGFSRVSVSDGVAYDGVLQGMSDVIIPPKKLADGSMDIYDGSEELTVEDLKARLAHFMQEDSVWEDL